ncbi:MAG TPA: mercury(II) reductase [Balneolaceae bacterium]|nr:mercury(II) reductase [Balneolaceae bacterium]
MNNETIHLSISGMTCDGCARTVSKQFDDKEGVLNKNVSYPEEQAEITYNPKKISRDEIIDTINATGHYKVTGEISDGDIGRDRYSLVIIGGGSAAFAAAIRASELGGSVLILNKGLPTGGTCVNVGCIPSKTLIRTAEAHHRAAHPGFEGIETQSRIADFKKIIEQERSLVADLRKQKYIDVISDDTNITLLKERGKLIDKHTVEAGGKKYSAENILIATGASTYIPDVPGLEEADFLTNETIYKLKDLPRKLLIFGGGYIALENAQLFARLGSEVTLIQRSEHVLSEQPEELAREITNYLQDDGIKILTNTKLQRVFTAGDETIVKIKKDGEETMLKATHLLVAAGRQGNTKDLQLDAAGLTSVDRGYVPVNKTMCTAVNNIFAAGDVTGKHQFVYTAAYEGKLAADNALRSESRNADYSVLPWVIFTDPQIAGIGLDERQARQEGLNYDTAKLSLDNVPRSIVARDTRGFIKLIRNRDDDQIIGSRILAPEGSELLMELALAMRHGVTVETLTEEFHPYLTLSEGIKLAALAFDKNVNKLSCCAV